VISWSVCSVCYLLRWGQRAVSNQAATAYDQAIANYRQTVLIGFQQVEDNKAAFAYP